MAAKLLQHVVATDDNSLDTLVKYIYKLMSMSDAPIVPTRPQLKLIPKEKPDGDDKEV